MKKEDSVAEIEKSKSQIMETIEYLPNAIVTKNTTKKTTGNVTVSCFDAGEELAKKTSPFDTYIQIIDGTAEISIKDKLFVLKLGDGIIIPTHAKHHINAKEPLKMISTNIKSENHKELERRLKQNKK